MSIGNVAADFEASGPRCRVSLIEDRYAFEVLRIDIVAVPIYDIAECAVFKGAFPRTPKAVVEVRNCRCVPIIVMRLVQESRRARILLQIV